MHALYLIMTYDTPMRWPDQGNAIPKSVFQRDDIYRQELDNIFHGSEWHPVAHQCELPESGDYKTHDIGEIPVLVMHDSSGEFRVFVNACPHRGTQLKTETRGRAKTIECPYHRWTFAVDGRLLGAPGMGDFPASFRKEDHGLRELRSAVVHGLIFASCADDAPAIEEYLGGAADAIEQVFGGPGDLRLLGYQKVSFATNWKEYSDNEGYHAPLLHGAFRLLGWQGGKGEIYSTPAAHKVTSAKLSHAVDNGFLNDFSLIEKHDKQTAPDSIIVTLFPVTVIICHLDTISVRYALPRSAHQTDVHYAYFARGDDSPELCRHRVRQASNLLGPSGLISLEDGAVFNRLHVGSRSGGNVRFQRGVTDDFQAPAKLQQNDEAGNLVRWERYRNIMGFIRG